MEKLFDIVSLGELLIDFSFLGMSATGQKLFEQNPGGAPANVLCMASKLGMHTAFIGKVGDDMHGKFLRDTLKAEKIDTRGLVMSKDVFTTLAFVSISSDGEREFSFSRKPGADTRLEESELSEDLLSGCRIFHFGSLSLTDEPARSATLAALHKAKNSGAIISYDPNYRAPLWEGKDNAREMMLSPIPYVDYLKVSEEEALLLTEKENIDDAIKALLIMGARCVVVTLGSDGAIYASADRRIKVPSFRVEHVVDTTGAGDAFWGAFLSRICCKDNNVEDSLRFANAAAALCVSKRGAIPSMPTAEEIKVFINDN